MKNPHARVQLKRTPHRLDEYGRKLPALADDWIIEEVSADGAYQEPADAPYDDFGKRPHLRLRLQS